MIIIFLSSFFVLVRAILYNMVSERIANHLRFDLYHSLINKDVEFYDERKTGDLLSRIGADIAVV